MGYIFKGKNTIKVPYGRYGWVRNGGKTFHGGMDISTVDDPTIHATTAGVVKYARVVQQGAANWGNTWEWGYFVWVVDYAGYSHIYAHCEANSLMVKENQHVLEGQPIARMGDTGNAKLDSQGKHVHYEVRNNYTKKAVDPSNWCLIPNEVGSYENGEKENAKRMFKIYEPLPGVVSSQQVSEGVILLKDSDGLFHHYWLDGDSRLAREYTETTKSEVFEALQKEMQPGEILAST